LAWVFPWYYGFLFFLGAVVALFFERQKPKLAEEFTLPMASGVVAGGSLMGVVLVFWANGGSILNKLLGGLKEHTGGVSTPSQLGPKGVGVDDPDSTTAERPSRRSRLPGARTRTKRPGRKPDPTAHR